MILGRFFTQFSDFLGRVHGNILSPKAPPKKIVGVVPHKEFFFFVFAGRVRPKNGICGTQRTLVTSKLSGGKQWRKPRPSPLPRSSGRRSRMHRPRRSGVKHRLASTRR